MVSVRLVELLVPMIVDKECIRSGGASNYNIVICVGLVLLALNFTVFGTI